MEKVAEYVRQVLETLRSQIQETNHQLNQSSSAYSVLGRKMEEMELLFASSKITCFQMSEAQKTCCSQEGGIRVSSICFHSQAATWP